MCDLRLPLSACTVCGIGNRAGAAFCRRCRAGLLTDGPYLHSLEDIPPRFTAVPGDFRRGPLFLDGSAYAVNTDGHLLGVSLRDGSRVRVLGAIDPAAAFNQAALVKVRSPFPGKGGIQPGWTHLGISPRKVEAISLVTGESQLLYEASGGSQIAVNAAGAGARFSGVAATGHLFAFAESAPAGQADTDQIVLVVCGFSGKLPGNLPADRPLAIDGVSGIGPVLADDVLALCTERAVGVYDLRHLKSFQMPLPPHFTPLLVRRQGGLSVPVGGIPLTAARGANGLEAWIGGEENGVPGILIAELERRSSRFERTPRAATLASNCDGTLSLAAEDEVRILGTRSWKVAKLNLQQGMPAFAAGGLVVSFAATGRAGRHNVILSRPDRGAVATLAFEDPLCTPETVCGAAVMPNAAAGTDVAISYLPTGSGNGFTAARWRFEPATDSRPS